MLLPHDPVALAAALPDVPRWVETRSLLLSGDAVVQVSHDGDAALVLDATLPAGAVVGRADVTLLREALTGVPDDFELVVQTEALRGVEEALPGWDVAHVIVHILTHPHLGGRSLEPGVIISQPPERRWLEGLPEDIQLYAGLAEAIAVRVVDGGVVAVCAAGDVTESLWDVGIDTMEDHRRCGHARACFTALAAVLAQQGRQPVWSAYADYPPSLQLAAKLGFAPVDRLAVLSPRQR